MVNPANQPHTLSLAFYLKAFYDFAVQRVATFDSSFWIHVVYVDCVDFLRADYALICTQAVAEELGTDNPTSVRLQELLSLGSVKVETPQSAKVNLYGSGERAALNLALERNYVLLIDDWRPYEAAQAAGIEVVNTVAYLVQLYERKCIPFEQAVSALARLTRRGTVRPVWLHSALTLVAEIRQKRVGQ